MLPGLNLQSEEEWRSAAEGTFREGTDGKLHIDWDPRILEPMRQRASNEELWQLFLSLKMIPVLGFRGELSEILSAKTFERMAASLPKFEAVTIAGAGHTPSLSEPEARFAIDAFLERTLADVNRSDS
jgi:pimeloyl-ACP methyl ester carboxylesterase